MATKFGGAGDNDIEGTKFSDKLWGKGGDDRLWGFEKDDKLFGGFGEDVLRGGKGDDRLWGDSESGDGNEKDTFIFSKNSGKDIIEDFDVKKDMLSIQKGLNGIEKPKDLLKLKLVSQKDGDLVIDLGGGNKITLKNVSLDEFKKDINKHVDII